MVHTLAISVFLFTLWRRLKDDYLPNQIFSTAFLSLMGVAILGGLSKYVFGNWWFWLSLAGLIVGSILGLIKYRIRIYEYVDYITVPLMFWTFMLFLGDAVGGQNWYSLILSIISILILTLYYFLNKNYRKFSWYKSGKIGFAGLASLLVYFMIRALLAVFFPFMISFVGKTEIIVSGALALVLSLTLLQLSIKNQ